MRKRGIKISMDGGACRIVPVLVTGFESAAQNALVNLITTRGTDKLFAERGTDLSADVYSGAWGLNAVHASNMASVDTKVFCRATSDCAKEDKIASIIAQPVSIVKNRAQVEVAFISEGGQTIGNATSF